VVTLVNIRAYWRFLRVTRQFLPLLLAYARDRRRFLVAGGPRRLSRDQHRRRARKLLDSLLTLGPTFIKLGQLLSTRPDVLPPSYIDVLARLQDDVPPAPWEDTREVVESELGPVDERFDGFDTNPISGASLGQVYVATYRGQKVAVKVRRPGVDDLVEADLKAVQWILPILLYFVDENRAFSMRNLADEFAKTIREEMDYRREGRMLEAIRANFVDDETVVIPSVIEEVSTDRVLTMEYIPGTKITRVGELDRKGIDRSRLAENLQRAYMQMMVEDGVFHADPHPGNLAVADEGRIVFYDFGMSGRVDPFIQGRIVDFYTAVAGRDIDEILDTLIAMGTLSPEADRGLISEVMEVAIQDARGEQVDQYRVQQIVNQVEDTIYEFPLRMPQDLALVLRVATVVEGVCVTLDEDFDFISVATSYLRERGYFEETIRTRITEYGQDVRNAAGSILRTPPKLERALDRLERNNFEVQTNLKDSNDLLDRLATRLVYGLLVAVGGLSTALLYATRRPTATWVAGAITAVLVVQLYRKFRGPKGLRTGPQFTRQNLRERRRTDAAMGEEDEGVTRTLAVEDQPTPTPGSSGIPRGGAGSDGPGPDDESVSGRGSTEPSRPDARGPIDDGRIPDGTEPPDTRESIQEERGDRESRTEDQKTETGESDDGTSNAVSEGRNGHGPDADGDRRARREGRANGGPADADDSDRTGGTDGSDDPEDTDEGEPDRDG